MDVGINNARANRIDANPLGRNFFGQTEVKGVDGALAGGVIYILAGRAHAGCNAAEIDDRTALATVFCAHAQNGFARAKHGADHVDAHHALQALPT